MKPLWLSIIGAIIGTLIMIALVASMVWFAYQWKTSIRLLGGIPMTAIALSLLFGPTNLVNIVFFPLIVGALLMRPPKAESFGYSA